MTKTPPIGRTTHASIYSSGNERPQVLHGTWLESESFCYPAGGFTRRAYAELRKNPNNPIDLPYGRRYVVLCSIPDTYFSIPARLRYRGKTIRGFVSVTEPDTDTGRFTFTPEAAEQPAPQLAEDQSPAAGEYLTPPDNAEHAAEDPHCTCPDCLAAHIKQTTPEP